MTDCEDKLSDAMALLGRCGVEIETLRGRVAELEKLVFGVRELVRAFQARTPAEKYSYSRDYINNLIRLIKQHDSEATK